jgi:hypothetical protein
LYFIKYSNKINFVCNKKVRIKFFREIFLKILGKGNFFKNFFKNKSLDLAAEIIGEVFFLKNIGVLLILMIEKIYKNIIEV